MARMEARHSLVSESWTAGHRSANIKTILSAIKTAWGRRVIVLSLMARGFGEVKKRESGSRTGGKRKTAFSVYAVMTWRP